MTATRWPATPGPATRCSTTSCAPALAAPSIGAGVLAHPFFEQGPPKSLDRNAFAFADGGLPDCSVPDGAATLAALTPQAVARVVPLLPRPPKSWIVAGGGARNRTIMRMLARQLAPASVETADAVRWWCEAPQAPALAYTGGRHPH